LFITMVLIRKYVMLGKRFVEITDNFSSGLNLFKNYNLYYVKQVLNKY